jgi:hypothetical protein
VIVSIIGAIASAFHWDALWYLLLPGAFLAAVFFPEGVNSSGGTTYLVVAGFFDVAFFAVIVFWLLKLYDVYGTSSSQTNSK